MVLSFDGSRMSSDRRWKDRDASGDLGTALAVFAVGMVLPVLAVLAAPGLPRLYANGTEFTTVSAVLFGLGFWALVETRGLDRVDVAVASVIGPAVAFVAAVGGLVVMSASIEGYGVGPWDPVVDYLAPSVGHLFGYVLAFGLAGLAAVGLGRWTRRQPGLPSPGRVATGRWPSSRSASPS